MSSYACVNACADAHDGVTRLIRDGLRFDQYLVATSCRQCRDPLCMVGCPVGSIRRRNSLEVIIEDWCIGCGLCAQNCPYGNINLHPFEALAEEMNLTPATLRRRLHEEGTFYQSIKDQLRRDLAIGYLSHSKRSAMDIGLELGFSERSAFHRAFKKRTGASPGEFRRRIQPSEPV